MTDTAIFTRRTVLAAGVALPFAGIAKQARAGGHMMGPSMPTHARITLGSFEVTTLLAGARTVEGPQGIFGMNVSEEEFASVSHDNFLPTDAARFYFTPTLVNTGSELILFDTGLNPQGITEALAAAGHAPDQIDMVVITHMHGDHIGGLIGDGETFPNARYVTGQVEYDYWAGAGNDGFEAKVRPLTERMAFIGDGDSVAPGITAVAAFGHTPGHMGFMIESGGAQIFLMADTANHYVWSLAYPDWEVRFDMDKAMAAETRRRIFGMLAAERVPLIGYHMPFPAMGYVDTRGDGFHYVPHAYQLIL